MSQETLNIIIGALIGFIPSVLVAYFGYRFQMVQKEKERKWQIDDLKRCRNKEVVETRINQVERFIITNFDTLQLIEMAGEKVFADEDSFQKLNEIRKTKASEINALLIFASSLRNDKLIELLTTLKDNTNYVFYLINETRNVCLINGKLSQYDIDCYYKTLTDYSNKIYVTTQYAIQQFDFIRKQVY